MKLIYRIVIRISLLLILVLGVWAVFFYMAMMDEVNDEVDDSLEDYSEVIIIRTLAGEELPSQNTGSNNQYYLREVTEEYADSREDITYKDSMVYIVEKGETEPARILTTIFKDDENRFYELTVSTPSIEKEDLTAAIRNWMIFLYVALLLVIIVVNVWVFQQSMRPLYVLLHWLDGYRIGSKNKPLENDTQITEFRKLNEAAIRNAERSEQLFEQQKQFIGNASHEIQTPLAICRNRLEMMMEDESLSESQLEELMKTHQTLEHITKLNKSLLLLSKIDNGQFTETVELELNELLKQYLDDYKEVYAYREIQTEVVEKGVFRVQMNESLATILITNLLKNAFVHNVDGGHIRIEITSHRFTFCNSGVDKAFVNKAKTEREFVAEAVRILSENGYQEYEIGKKYETGDKVYFINRKKALIMTTFGCRPLEEGIRLNIAHIDSPRLDLKPNPLYEKTDLAFLKTHYYGGIRKYQWATIPLAMHGVVITKDGTAVDICIGEDEGDPVFCVTDLLPHLAAEQNERKLKDGIKGEELNVLVGSIPYAGEEIKEPVKLLVLKLLNEKYGMTEKDFTRAEIEMVPAVKATDVGLDRSLVGAYGQDDKVCAYTAMTAEMATEKPEYTTVTVLADKEEIGSVGNTGLDSDFSLHYIEYLADAAGADVKTVLRNSICLSSDVNAAYDPTFASVYEEKNSCYVNKGCVLTKYTGARGKSGSNDASAETMATPF